MLEASVEENVTIDSGSFSQYVRDEWHWKEQFFMAARANSTYDRLANRSRLTRGNR